MNLTRESFSLPIIQCPAVTICFLEIKEPPHKMEGALPLYFRIAAVHGYFEMVVLILPVFESVVHWVFYLFITNSTFVWTESLLFTSIFCLLLLKEKYKYGMASSKIKELSQISFISAKFLVKSVVFCLSVYKKMANLNDLRPMYFSLQITIA